MSNYTIGIDIGRGDDQTMYCISKRPNRLVRFVNSLFKRGETWKIIYVGNDPTQIRKYRYRKARVLEEA